jgi:hypothetical protein
VLGTARKAGPPRNSHNLPALAKRWLAAACDRGDELRAHPLNTPYVGLDRAKPWSDEGAPFAGRLRGRNRVGGASEAPCQSPPQRRLQRGLVASEADGQLMTCELRGRAMSPPMCPARTIAFRMALILLQGHVLVPGAALHQVA